MRPSPPDYNNRRGNPMTFTQIRIQVDVLSRKYATELQVYRARSIALQFCDEMADAVTGSKPGPQRPLLEWALILQKRLNERGIRLKNFLSLYDYLESCLDRRILPQVNDVLRSLMPQAALRGLIPRSIRNIPF